MKCTFLFIALVSFLSYTAKADHYAVLVAGSNYFYNYRHQADIFHAYQALIAHGIKAENIITFAYDDIANDPSNPFPGKVFNKPTTGPGKDVYKGTKIDYSGADVTPQNFLSVLKGDSKATKGKKVLNTTSEDHVFIYFSDHGAAGLIAFPSEYLYANDFMDALTYMYQNKKYQQMVIYIEACEAGSMFDSILPGNISIYTTTASNPDESSWATYCSPNDTVDGTEIGTCLGDLYSVNFLENLDPRTSLKETLLKQFTIVKKETTMSHVQQYGNLTIDKEVVGDFEGNSAGFQFLNQESGDQISKELSAVNSRYVKLAYLERRHKRFNQEGTRRALEEEMYSIQEYDSIFTGIQEMFSVDVNTPVKNIDFKCLKLRVEMYEVLCGKFSDYGLRYVRYIHFTCAQKVDVYDYEAALINFCF